MPRPPHPPPDSLDVRCGGVAKYSGQVRGRDVMTAASGRGAHVRMDTCPERHVLLLEAVTRLLVRALLLVIFFLKKVVQVTV